MGSKFEFDETRKAIGAHELSEQERKAMLEKFRSAGGKVLNEKEVRPPTAPQYSGSKTGLSAGGGGRDRGAPAKLPSEMERERRRAMADKAEREREAQEKLLRQFKGPGARFFIKLRCLMAGVAGFGSAAIKPKFINYLSLDVRQALVEFNLTGNDLFFQNPAIGRKIIHNLDAKNPLLMEVLEAAHHLYHAPSFNSILEFSQAHPGAATPLEPIAKPLKDLFRALYLIYPFQETLKKAFSIAFDTYLAEQANADRSQLEAKRRKVIEDVKVVFQGAFPKLFLLICRLDETDYPPFSPMLEKALGIKPEDKLGKRRKGETSALMVASSSEAQAAQENPENSEQTKAAEETQETKKEKKEERNPILSTKEYQYGYSLMKLMNPANLREKYDPRGRFAKLPDNDKVLLAYLYFMEFDHEYSFVLTTNKIKLNVDYTGGTKTDYKKMLADLYNDSRGVIRAFEKYNEAVENLNKLKVNKLSSNYIEQSKLEAKSEGHVDIEARNTRGLIRTYMENIYKNLGRLIADMKGAKTIVANANEIIRFDSEFEGNKRLNGKPVQHCILEAYCFALALKERLESGDLYGGIIHLDDNEMVELFGPAYAPKAASENP